MSIREEWQKLVDEEVLFKLEPALGDSEGRTVLMSKEVRDLVLEPWEGDQATRCARLLATLENIVSGRLLKVCLKPFKARKAVMGRLSPIENGIWDIRCQDAPALRVFGGFLERDVFLALICVPRSKRLWWLPRLPLGIGQSKEWKRAIAETKKEWAKLFPANFPVSGECVNEYLTKATLE